ncbi:MAG: SDR family oxidoreductase [Bacteroidota bacterium]
MKELILITGASSGIGLEMAKILASRGYDLIVTARRKDRLDSLKSELQAKYNVSVHVFLADLSNVDNASKLYREIKTRGLKVTMLVNNAGFGEYGDFTKTILEKELEMIQLNISSLVILSKLFAQDMRSQEHGSILNVGSLLSYFPFPYYAVYAASKAFVLSFSEAIRAELQGTNVRVSVLCPGPTETEFTSAQMLSTNSYKNMKMEGANAVASKGVDLLLNKNTSSVVGFMNKVVANTPRFSPRWMTLKINKHMASQVS